MGALYERSILEAIEGHNLAGEHDMARKLMLEYAIKKNRFQKKNNELKKKNEQIRKNEQIKKNLVFEGTLVAAGWDLLERINQSSLYTQDDEDILLEHNSGIKKFLPFLNQKVRIWGDITSIGSEERKIYVKRIVKIIGGFSKPLTGRIDEFGSLIDPAA